MEPSVLILKNDLSSQIDQALNFVLLTPLHQQVLLFAPTIIVLSLAFWSYWKGFLRRTRKSKWGNARVHKGESYHGESKKSHEKIPVIFLISLEDHFFQIIGQELKVHGYAFECISSEEEVAQKIEEYEGKEIMVLDLDHIPNQSNLSVLSKKSKGKAALLLLGELEKTHYLPIQIISGDSFLKKKNIKNQMIPTFKALISEESTAKKVG